MRSKKIAVGFYVTFMLMSKVCTYTIIAISCFTSDLQQGEIPAI